MIRKQYFIRSILHKNVKLVYLPAVLFQTVSNAGITHYTKQHFVITRDMTTPSY